MYYKMKLEIHIFTLKNLGTHEGFYFSWNETEESITSNKFPTIICKFLQTQLPLLEAKTKVILYSDGSTYKNRSTALVNGLLHHTCTKNVTIEQKYSEVCIWKQTQCIL